jgi:hypothetical protein
LLKNVRRLSAAAEKSSSSEMAEAPLTRYTLPLNLL